MMYTGLALRSLISGRFIRGYISRVLRRFESWFRAWFAKRISTRHENKWRGGGKKIKRDQKF